MGALRGSVTKRASGTDPGLPSYHQRPYLAHNARGVQIGTGYSTAQEAKKTVERSVGVVLRWIRRDLAHVEHWAGEDTLADPNDIFGDELQLWARIIPNPAGDGYVGYLLYAGSSTDVRIWGDASGEEHRLTSPSQATSPSVSLVGDPSMVFVRATNDRLTTSYTLPATSGFTLSLVGQAGASGGGTARALWVDGVTDSVLGEAGDRWVYANSGGAIVSGVTALNRLAQVTAVQYPTSPPGARLYVDTALAGSSAGAAVTGTLLVSSTGADAWNGEILEIVVASVAATTYQLMALAAYYRRQHPGLT